MVNGRVKWLLIKKKLIEEGGKMKQILQREQHKAWYLEEL
jgi:hypothetical protein